MASSSTNRKRESDELLEKQGLRSFTVQEIKDASLFLHPIEESDYVGMHTAYLQHTHVALKLFRSHASLIIHLKKEIEVLSKIHHPRILLLLGACPEKNCLVYEYMESGTLHDRLNRKDNTRSLPWYTRFTIAWEVASALNFLHLSKPDPIVHWDLHLQNIWLDEHYKTKIGGLSLAFTENSLSQASSHPKPTEICYMDPEFLRTGRIQPSSDVYALGLVLLQLITAKPPIGLVDSVERAIDNNIFSYMVDKGAGEWPLKETLQLAKLGLKCVEFQRKYRADMAKDILPELSRLKDLADKASPLSPLPSFTCPISQEVMADPHVAADGFSYDLKYIKTWLERKKTSPMTNLPLSSTALFPNRALKSVIQEWKSKIGIEGNDPKVVTAGKDLKVVTAGKDEDSDSDLDSNADSDAESSYSNSDSSSI